MPFVFTEIIKTFPVMFTLLKLKIYIFNFKKLLKAMYNNKKH